MTDAPQLDESRGREVAPPSWTTILPDDWWRIPLADPAARTRAIKRIVQEQFGYADADASVKRRTQADLLSSASNAHAAGGRQMALAHMDLAGVMVTATMVVYEVPLIPVGEDPVTHFFADVAAGLPESAEVLQSEISAGRVLRTVRATDVVRPDPVSTEMPEVPELRADYWVALSDVDTVLYFVFTSPFVPLRSGLVELFDTIVESLHLAGAGQ